MTIPRNTPLEPLRRDERLRPRGDFEIEQPFECGDAELEGLAKRARRETVLVFGPRGARLLPPREDPLLAGVFEKGLADIDAPESPIGVERGHGPGGGGFEK